MQGEIEMNEWAMYLYFGRSDGWKGKSRVYKERRNDTYKIKLLVISLPLKLKIDYRKRARLRLVVLTVHTSAKP